MADALARPGWNDGALSSFSKGVCVRSTPIFIAVMAGIFATALVADVIRFAGFRNPMGLAIGASALLAGLVLGLKRRHVAVTVGLILSCAPFC